MILKRSLSDIQKEYPQEIAYILEKIKNGNNKLKNSTPADWEWGFDFAVKINLKQNLMQQSNWDESFKNSELFINVYAQLGNSYYHSDRVKTMPSNFQNDVELSTKKSLITHYQQKTSQLNLVDAIPVYVEHFEQGKPYLQEHLLLGSYMSKHNHNIIALNNSGLLCIYEMVDNEFSYKGAANNAFVKSIEQASHKINNTVSYNKQKYPFINATDTMTSILKGNDAITKTKILVDGFELKTEPSISNKPLTKRKMF